jgi:hypothetical protein
MSREREFAITDLHDEWLELCALATANALAPSEREKLRRHLDACAHCRAACDEYRLVTREGMPLVADACADLEDSEDLPTELSGWDKVRSKRALFAKLDQPIEAPQPTQTPQQVPLPATSSPSRGTGVLALWMGVAACLLAAAGIGGYQMGKRGVLTTPSSAPPLLAEVQALSAQRADLDKRLGTESANVVLLQSAAAQAREEIAQLGRQLHDSEMQAGSASAAKAAADHELAATTADRDSLAARLQSVQADYESVKTELTKITAQRQQDLLHSASLEVEVNDLNRRLRDAERHVTDDNQYLASDRDIRELMGARQLYIADVTDVDQNGDSRKPFGRVFYTKGKSLIFYAFDLDRQPGLKEVSTFQAWAREGSDNAKPVSLGIFYVDSETSRRWVLKTDDPKVLAQINAVFVTVEPKGGSRKPSGKQLLYAYLRSASPNHP